MGVHSEGAKANKYFEFPNQCQNQKKHETLGKHW